MQGKPAVGQTYRIVGAAKHRGRLGVATHVEEWGAAWMVSLRIDGEPVEAGLLATHLEPAETDAAQAPAPAPPAKAAARPVIKVALDDVADADDTSEAAEGRRFVCAVAALSARYPNELGTARPEAGLPDGWRVYHPANEGRRGGAGGARDGAAFGAQGLRSGVPDYQLDLPRWDGRRRLIYHGWRGELKRETGGDVRPAQIVTLKALRHHGYWARTHNGHEEMLQDLEWYLSLPPVTDCVISPIDPIEADGPRVYESAAVPAAGEETF